MQVTVTKLLYLRGACLDAEKKVLGYSPRRIAEAWRVDPAAITSPTSCYETFVSSYLQRIATVLQVPGVISAHN